MLTGILRLVVAAAALLSPVLAPARGTAAELVMFESALCEWCAAWHTEVGPVYPRTREGRLAPLRRVDIHGPRPADLEFLRAVRYTPTFVLVHEGREIGRITGYMGEDFFWGLLGELIDRLPPSNQQTVSR